MNKHTTRSLLAALAGGVVMLGCADPVAVTAPTAMPSAHFKRVKVTTADTPLAFTQSSLTLAVGETVTVASVYTIEKAPNFLTFFWGCRTTDPDAATPWDCWSNVSIVPTGVENAQAAVTGRAPGTLAIYVADGLGLWAYLPVTVTP